MLKKIVILITLIATVGIGWFLFYSRENTSSLRAQPSRADADSFSKKLAELALAEQNNSARRTEFRESEVEAFVTHELAPLLPKGVKRVDIRLLQSAVSATSLVNFDELETSGGGHRNPLISALFRGEHSLDVVALLKTQNHTGSYEVSKVLLDQREIPKPLVDLLVEKYVVPKYPAAKPNTPFALPYNIERVDLLPGKAIVHQSGK